MREHGSLTATPSGTPQGGDPLAAVGECCPLGARPSLRGGLARAYVAATRASPGAGPPQPSNGPLRGRFRDPGSWYPSSGRVPQEANGRADELSAAADASPEKTRITHVDEGFDFLGFRIVRLPRPGRTPVAFSFPSKEAVNGIRRRIKELTGSNTTNLTLDALLHALNPVLRVGTAHYRHAASKRTFTYLDHYLWQRLVGWLRKKHSRLPWKQIRRRYWGRNWSSNEGTRLYWPSRVAVTRYNPRRHHLPWTTSGTTGPPAGRSVVAT